MYVSCISFLDDLHQVEIPSMLLFMSFSFLSWVGVGVWPMLFQCHLIWSYDFSSLVCCGGLQWFIFNVEPVLPTWNKPHSIRVHNSLLDSFACPTYSHLPDPPESCPTDFSGPSLPWALPLFRLSTFPSSPAWRSYPRSCPCPLSPHPLNSHPFFFMTFLIN